MRRPPPEAKQKLWQELKPSPLPEVNRNLLTELKQKRLLELNRTQSHRESLRMARL